LATALGYVALNGSRKALQRRLGVLAGRGLHHLVQQLLGVRLQALGQRVEDVGDLVHPARLAARTGEHVPERRPRPQRAVADDELGLVEPRCLRSRMTVAQDSVLSR
jgi:hypothetical protein